MGFLSETKIKRKLAHDPNNTKWTRDENTFGQKILRAHGWEPGQYLGAQDTSLSELHTAANASYIRVALKDDSKGLGFDKARRDDSEITGLDVFTDLLSRLNGKSAEAVEEEQKARLVVKTHRFVEHKYGSMRFVRGGLLVGDELKAVEDGPEEEKKGGEDAVEVEAEAKKDKKPSKKRKASSLDEDKDEDDTPATTEDSESKKKRKKRSTDVSGDNTPTEDTKAKRKEKKSKKDKSPKDTPATSESEAETTKKSKQERKEEKRLKKKRKEEKKEEKRRRKAEAKSSSSKSTSPDPTTATTTTADATPAGSGTSTPRVNPHFVRSRFLKAKREAMMDSNAISKIFMMKA